MTQKSLGQDVSREDRRILHGIFIIHFFYSFGSKLSLSPQFPSSLQGAIEAILSLLILHLLHMKDANVHLRAQQFINSLTIFIGSCVIQDSWKEQ